MANYGINFYTGKYGHGKTYLMISRLWTLKRVVYPSINWIIKKINSYFKKTIPEKKLIVIGNLFSPYIDVQYRGQKNLIEILDYLLLYKMQLSKTDRIILIVDEAQLIFPKGDDKEAPKWLRPFLYQIRKLELTIEMTAPRSYMVHKDIRAVVDYVFKVKKILGWFETVTKYEPLTDDWNENNVDLTKQTVDIVGVGFGLSANSWEWIKRQIHLKPLQYYSKEFITPSSNVLIGKDKLPDIMTSYLGPLKKDDLGNELPKEIEFERYINDVREYFDNRV